MLKEAKDELGVPWANIHEAVYACSDMDKMAMVREVIWGVKAEKDDFVRRCFHKLLGGRLIGLCYPRWPRG